MKKTLSLFLAFLMLLGLPAAAISCSTNGDGGETTVQTTAAADTDAPEETEPEMTVAVEDFSKNGQPRPFRMLVRSNRYSYLYVEEASGNPVEYAVYRRNLNLEEQYGIRFEITEGKGTKSSEKDNFVTFLAGATSDFDLVCFDYWWNLELQGMFLNILEMPEIDPDDEWWYQGWNSNVTLNGRMFSIAGDANLEMLENLEVVFFNKNIAADRSLDLYGDVNSGNWTIERMIEVINTVSSGLDDTDPTNDVYGVLYDTHSVGSQLFSAGIRMSELNADNVNLDIASSSRNVDICDLLGRMMQLPGVDYNSATARARDWSLFRDHRSLMYATALYLGQSLRTANLDFDYGILPMPKYTVEDEYVSSPYGVSVFAIPVTVSDPHVSAMVLNAMNFASARGDDSLVTTFYDIVLKYQIADSVEDVGVLEMVRDNVYVDFAYIYDGNLGLLATFKDAMVKGTPVSAALKGRVNGAKIALEKQVTAPYYD